MRIAGLAAVCLTAIAGMPAAASAQDTPKTGLVIGFPTSAGLIWHASPRLAIRPDFSISGTSSDSSGSFVTSASGWGTGVGVSVLFYTHSEEHLRTYFVPRFGYSHNSTTSETSNPNVFNTPTTVSGSAYGGSGSFGAQYALGNKFALFGELGVEVDRSSTKSTSSTTKIDTTHWGTRAGVGVVFYL